VPDIVISADSVRSPEMRHEVPLAIGDPFLYLEHEGKRLVVVTSFEVERVQSVGVPAIAPEALGMDELLAQGLTREKMELEVAVRACERLGIISAAVPPSFPLELAERLRAAGIRLEVDRDLFEGRRRAKNDAEQAGVRRAQRAAEAGMARVAELLRASSPGPDGVLRLDSEPLTSERLRAEAEQAVLASGATGEDLIVAAGAQGAVGHEPGTGPIRAGDPVIADIFPRDRETGCYADMTRTFVVGEPSQELVDYHGLCREALDLTMKEAKPGVRGADLHRLVCELFERHGQPTQLSKQPGETLRDGFFHSLGHGVGLEVHEAPGLGRNGAALVPGDVIAVEPGLYRHDRGGCRLEDLLLVTDDGVELLTEYPYDLTP
jgi:Xaa-Pro aminopeptidase